MASEKADGSRMPAKGSTIKVQARRAADGATTVKSLIRHPMDSGFEFDYAFRLIPPHYIELLTFRHKGRVVFECDWGPAVSMNPYIAFRFRGAEKGDALEIHWVDNEGEHDSLTTKIV